MAVREILQLGDPMLRATCERVMSFQTDELHALTDDLRDTLYDFRSRSGFGRGIAAPQLGVTQRVILVHIDHPIVLVNPKIVKRSRGQMTLWDDCFSFPDLLIKVRRNLVIEVRYQDDMGHHHTLKAEGALSELLQHEIDHITGVLAIDRAIDSKHIVYRSVHMKSTKEQEGVLL